MVVVDKVLILYLDTLDNRFNQDKWLSFTSWSTNNKSSTEGEIHFSPTSRIQHLEYNHQAQGQPTFCLIPILVQISLNYLSFTLKINCYF